MRADPTRCGTTCRGDVLRCRMEDCQGLAQHRQQMFAFDGRISSWAGVMIRRGSAAVARLARPCLSEGVLNMWATSTGPDGVVGLVGAVAVELRHSRSTAVRADLSRSTPASISSLTYFLYTVQ